MNSPAALPLQAPPTRGVGPSHGVMHLAMFFVTFCWAANIVAVKEALTGFGPVALAQLRLLATALVYGVLFCAIRSLSRLRLTGREWVFMGLVAINGMTINQLCFMDGIARSTVAHTGLIVALGPVMVLVLACLMRMEALTVLKFVGMLISFGGVGILTLDKTGNGATSHWAGDLILLAGTAVFAYYTILMKQVANRFDAVTLNLLSFGLGAFLMLPIGFHSLLQVGWTTLPARAWWGLAYMVVLGSVLPYVIFAVALTVLAASRVAAFNYLQPFIASSLGIWLLGEKLTARVVAGGALILLGIYLTERERGEAAAVALPCELRPDG